MKKYIYVVAIAVIVGVIGDSIYKEINKGAKSIRLECHKNSTVFEKILKPTLIEKLQSGIKSGNIKVMTEIKKAKYMESELFNYVDPNMIKREFEELLGKKSFREKSPASVVSILIYENDKKDPGKKTEKSKLYAGYLVFSYKVENSLVYKLQIDFFNKQGADIQKVLKCGLESMLTL